MFYMVKLTNKGHELVIEVYLLHKATWHEIKAINYCSHACVYVA